MKQENHIYNLNIEDFMTAEFALYVDSDVVYLDQLKGWENEYDSIKLNAVLILICTKGKLNLDINMQSYEAIEGDMLFGLPNSILGNYNATPDFECKILCLSPKTSRPLIHLDSETQERMFQLLENPILRLDHGKQKMLLSYYDILRQKISEPRSIYQKNIILSFIHAIIYEILAGLNIKAPITESRRLMQGDILMKKFFALLMSTDIKPRSVGYYADRLAVTSKYLSTVCKKMSGKTAFQWINDAVMKDILHLLMYSDKSIKEISQYLDFPNTSFFSKFVKAHMGISPTDYRKQQIQSGML